MLHSRTIVRVVMIVAVCLALPLGFAAQTRPGDTDWPTYGGDLRSTRYMPLDQITASNFNKLEVAWRLKTDSFGPRPEFNFQSTPLVVNGVLYTTAGTRRAVVALDAATGELLWVHRLDEGKRGEAAPRQAVGPRPRLLDRRQAGAHRLRHARLSDGRARREDRAAECRPSARDGIVDLKLEIDQASISKTGDIGLHATPIIAKRRHRRRRGAPARRHAEEPPAREGLHPRLRRAHRQAAVDLPHDSAARRVRPRHVGKRVGRLHRATSACGRR